MLVYVLVQTTCPSARLLVGKADAREIRREMWLDNKPQKLITIVTIFAPRKQFTMWTETDKFRELTGFQKAVLFLCYTCPPGQVVTYGAIGAALLPGRPCAQAVGNALRHNPFAPEVPCHRVVKADGSIGGFNGVDRKSVV